MRKIKDPVKLVFEFILVGILFFIFYIALSYHNFYEKRADFTAKGTDFSNISNFLDITKIKANIKDAPITVIESNVSEITVSSTVKNRGIGIITSPKAWKSNGVLHFDQGYVIGHNEKSTGAVTIQVPMGMILYIDIKSGSGDVTVDISHIQKCFYRCNCGRKKQLSQKEIIF